MANEVTVRAPALTLTEKEARNYAAAFAASGMFKSAGANMSADQVLVCIMAGQEFGWGPAAALMNLHVIEGRPELSADAQARFIKASGKYEYRVTEHTNEACEITVLAVPSGEVIGVERYTMEDAKLAGLGGPTRGGRPSQWMKSPRNMLFARCVSNVTAFHCPDALPMRTYTVGEIQDGHQEERLEAPKPTPEAMEAAQKIEDVVAEEIIEDAEIVGVANGQPVTEGDVKRMADEAEVGYELRPREGDTMIADRFAPEVVEARLRADVPQLDDKQKAAIKQAVIDSGKAFTYPNMASTIIEAGYSDVFSWMRSLEVLKVTPAPSPAPPRRGMTSKDTGSQTSVRTVTDSQIRLFNARCSDAGLSDVERKTILLRYAGVTSSRQIKPDDFDELLKVLEDIKRIDPTDTEVRAAYI